MCIVNKKHYTKIKFGGIAMKKYPIGFNTRQPEEKSKTENVPQRITQNIPRKSIVRIYFPVRNMSLTYYNDLFDLHCGDIVYVDGKLEGLQGKVIDVNYSFKIKLSEYKKVIAVADTNLKGEFHIAGSHIISFDPNAMPYEKVITWFKAPVSEEEVFVSGENEDSFPLEDLSKMKINKDVADRGFDYYNDNKVAYICLDGTHGKAIVEGSETYEVEFDYIDGDIFNLVCSCFCSFSCKHQFAAMLQLKETLKLISDNYSNNFNDYFAAVTKGAFYSFAVGNKETGKISL